MVGQSWADVVDDGPTLSQHWAKISYLLGVTCESDEYIMHLTDPFSCAPPPPPVPQSDHCE